MMVERQAESKAKRRKDKRDHMIKNIVFDIGNVLAGFVWEDFYRSFGYSEEIFGKLANATVKNPMWNEMDRGAMSDEELLLGFIRNDPSIERELLRVFENVRGMVRRYDYAIPWIRELKEKGLGIYIISNFARKAHKECADALDFLEEADGAILSYQVKLIKPDPEIYRLLCRNYGLEASECVFIDDTAKNVEVARAEGMAGIVFHTLEQAQGELAAMLCGGCFDGNLFESGK